MNASLLVGEMYKHDAHSPIGIERMEAISTFTLIKPANFASRRGVNERRGFDTHLNRTHRKGRGNETTLF